MTPDSRRVVILTASVGGGHDGPAREIGRRLSELGHRPEVVDVAGLVPWRLGRLLTLLFRWQLRLAPNWWGRIFGVLDSDDGPPSAVRRLADLIAGRVAAVLNGDSPGCGEPAAVAVSTFPLAGHAVAAARRLGVRTPLVTYITDPAVHRIWINDATHLYLGTWTATASEVWRHGPATISLVPPAVAPAFRCADSADSADGADGADSADGADGADSVDACADGAEKRLLRTALGLPDGPLALLTSGSWGVGDVIHAALDVRNSGVVTPVVVCGRNDRLRRRLARIPGLVVLGWTDQMAALMRACDVAVLNSGGLTLAEAATSGLPVIHYRPLPGQGTANAAVAQAHGLAPWPLSASELTSALTTWTTSPRTRQPASTPDDPLVAAILGVAASTRSTLSGEATDVTRTVVETAASAPPDPPSTDAVAARAAAAS